MPEEILRGYARQRSLFALELSQLRILKNPVHIEKKRGAMTFSKPTSEVEVLWPFSEEDFCENFSEDTLQLKRPKTLRKGASAAAALDNKIGTTAKSGDKIKGVSKLSMGRYHKS